MKRMTCPLNGERNISEFVYWGEVTEMPDPDAAPDGDWSDFVWGAANEAGVVREWWCHTASNYWFVAERDTRTDQILRTYPPKGKRAGRRK